MFIIFINILFSTNIENDKVLRSEDDIQICPLDLSITNKNYEEVIIAEDSDHEDELFSLICDLQGFMPAKIHQYLKKIFFDFKNSKKGRTKLSSTIFSKKITCKWDIFKKKSLQILAQNKNSLKQNQTLKENINKLKIQYRDYVYRSKKQFKICYKILENLLDSLHENDNFNFLSKEQLMLLSYKIYLYVPPSTLFNLKKITKQEKALRILMFEKLFTQIELFDMIILKTYNKTILNNRNEKKITSDVLLYQEQLIGELIAQFKKFDRIRSRIISHLRN